MMSLRGVCDADVYCAGHVHDQMARIVPMMGVPSKGSLKLVKRDIAFMRAGAFLEQGEANQGGYDQDHGYPASDNGLIVLEVNPQHGKMRRIEAPI
jgi:hypothetical protein